MGSKIDVESLAKNAIVDEKLLSELFDKYFSNIDGDRTMIAGQAALNSGKVAKAKPNLQTKITNKPLNIDKTHHGKQTVASQPCPSGYLTGGYTAELLPTSIEIVR